MVQLPLGAVVSLFCVSLVSFAAITLRVASQRVFYCCKRVFRYRLNPETFGYTLVKGSSLELRTRRLPVSPPISSLHFSVAHNNSV
jgi:hypothetical protein